MDIQKDIQADICMSKNDKIMQDILIKDIVQQLKDVENGDLWIDENFAKKLSLANEDNAFKRPLPDMHSVAELVSHLIEWRREVLSRLNGNPRGLEMSDTANWRSNDALKTKGWEDLLNDFRNTQQQLISFLEAKDDAFLDSPYPSADPSLTHNFRYLVTGLIHHDMYHMGQLGITIKFLNKSN